MKKVLGAFVSVFMPAAMSVLKDRLRSIRCTVWMRTRMSPTWNPAEHRIRAKLGLMTVSASKEEKWGARVTRDGGRKRKRACSLYAMPVYATPPSASPGTWMKWMNDGPGPQKRPSSIEAEQSIHRDEWGVNTNNNNNNSDIGGPYSYFSFIHMYAVTETHTYGPNTMGNIPLGTPPESSWEQDCSTKHRGKEASTVQAWKKKSPGIMSMQSAQWSGMRGHSLLSAISTLSGNPSVREARKPHVPPKSPPLPCWPSPSHSNYRIQILLCPTNLCWWTKNLHPWPWGRALRQRVFTSCGSCRDNLYKVCKSRQELGVKDEIQPWQHQEECSGSGLALRLDPAIAASHRIMVRLNLRSYFP